MHKYTEDEVRESDPCCLEVRIRKIFISIVSCLLFKCFTSACAGLSAQ